MFAQPAIADGLDDPTNVEKSPSRSPSSGLEFVTQAGLFVGAMIASRLFAASVAVMAAWAVEVANVRAAVQAGSDRPPVAWASSKMAEFQGPSSLGCSLLKSIRSWSVFGYFLWV